MYISTNQLTRSTVVSDLMQLQQQQQLLQGNLVQQVDSSLQALHSTLASPQTLAPWTANLQETMHQEMSAFSHRSARSHVAIKSQLS